MRRILMVLIALVCVPPVLAQMMNERVELMKLNSQARQFVSTWLNQNCGAEEQQRIEGRIKGLGPVLEPVFWEAYRLGPPEDTIKELQAHFRKQYGERQDHLKEFGDRLFEKEQIRNLLNITEEEYVQRETQQYLARYRTAALSGLGMVGTQTSELAPIARDVDNPAQGAAQEAIKAIGERSKIR